MNFSHHLNNNMTTPVPYKLALLLKEAKFDNFKCSGYYHLNEGYPNGYAYCHSEVSNQNDNLLLAPTISETITWLYDVHGLWAEFQYAKNCRKSFTFKFHNVKYIHKIGGTGVYYPTDKYLNKYYYESPEKCYMEALNYMIPILIKWV